MSNLKTIIKPLVWIVFTGCAIGSLYLLRVNKHSLSSGVVEYDLINVLGFEDWWEFIGVLMFVVLVVYFKIKYKLYK